MASTALGERIAAVLAIDPSGPAIEFGGRWRNWGAWGDGDQLPPVRPAPRSASSRTTRSIGFLLGAPRGCVVTINPGGRDRTRGHRARTFRHRGAPGDLADLVPGRGSRATTVAPPTSARRSRPKPAATPMQALIGPPCACSRADHRPAQAHRPGPTRRSSGLVGAKHYESNCDGPSGCTGVAIVNSPLVHLGGLFRVLQCVVDGRPFAFSSASRWTVGPMRCAATAPLPRAVPAAMRMVLESDLDPADLSSLRSVSRHRSARPDDVDTFTAASACCAHHLRRHRVRRGVAGWNLEDHRVWAAKRGVGAPTPGAR
jgi:hypothetical protein